MQIITKYKAFDGSEFSVKQECQKYEQLLRKINFIMGLLEAQGDIDFSNGSGYIQQEKFIFNRVRLALLLINQDFRHSDEIQKNDRYQTIPLI